MNPIFAPGGSIFQAIQDMCHTKLDLHAKFRPKKLAVRDTYAQKSRFLPKEEVSGFQAIRDMRHTKLDFHVEFHPKKFEARGTFAQKSRIFAPFFAQRGSIRISINMGHDAPYKVRPSCRISSQNVSSHGRKSRICASFFEKRGSIHISSN